MTGDTPKKRRFRRVAAPLGACIEPLTRQAFRAHGVAGAALLKDWENIVGPGLAARCWPLRTSFPKDKKSGGTLTLAVAPGFGPELQHAQALIIERLAVYFGYRAIGQIRLVPQPAKPIAPAKRKPKHNTELGETAARQIAATEDTELREALASFAGALAGDER